MKKFKKPILITVAVLVVVFGALQLIKSPSLSADWQLPVAVIPHAEFNSDTVTVHNVRNFRYGPNEEIVKADYYDRTYNLDEVKKVWYIIEPFSYLKYAAHTFVSFEFKNGDFLAISIEARKTEGQSYDMFKGLVRTYPLVYIAADERDVLLVRANIRKDNVYVYPVKLSDPKNGRLLLVDMLERMNELAVKPDWYNTLFANCTSLIAKHANNVSPGEFPLWSWQYLLTSYADKLLLDKGLLDTDLPVEEARAKYLVTEKSQKIGDVPNYSTLIRK